MTRATRFGLFAGLLLILAGLWLTIGMAHAQPSVAADPDAANHEILVLLRMPPDHFTPDASYDGGYSGGPAAGSRRRFVEARARAHGLTLIDAWPMPAAGLDCYIMAVPAGQSPDDAAATLSRDPGIEWAEPVRTYKAQGSEQRPTPGGHDPLAEVQPDYKQWRLSALHHMATGRNVRVAIIDSAIEVNHPDLAGQVTLSQNFVDGSPAPAAETHGTGVAGIIAAVANNNKGIIGVAPQARLMGLRACTQKATGQNATITTCDSLSLAKALYFAVDQKAEVINMSLAGPPDPLLGRLIDVAQAHGITVVGAVDRSLPGGGFPASHSGVVAVVDEEAEPIGAGIYGAPGRDIPTTQPGGNWFFVNGSSYAAAHVSGLFALMRERSRRPQTAQALALEAGSDAIDPCATLMRIAGNGQCGDLASQGSHTALRQASR
jgi:subtilisin family serine protease